MPDNGDDHANLESESNDDQTATPKVGDEVHGVTQLAQPSNDFPEADEFGLPLRPARRRQYDEESSDQEEDFKDAVSEKHDEHVASEDHSAPSNAANEVGETFEAGGSDQYKDATPIVGSEGKDDGDAQEPETSPQTEAAQDVAAKEQDKEAAATPPGSPKSPKSPRSPVSPQVLRRHRTNSSIGSGGAAAVSEWSHQQLAPQIEEEHEEEDEGQWQEMPAYATHRIYDDWGKVLAKEYGEEDHEYFAYGNLGGAGKGYTRVQIDEDAQSATSMDDNTAYLFKDHMQSTALMDEDEDGRDLVSQMQATKELLTEGQRIAYVGVVRLSIASMLTELNKLHRTKATKKPVDFAVEALKMWGQKMMVRLYAHMEISSSEQVMVEQLTEHGVLPSDLAPALMQNARVKNPQAAGEPDKAKSETSSLSSARPSMSSPRAPAYTQNNGSSQMLSPPGTPGTPSTPATEAPPAYENRDADDLVPADMADFEQNKNLDLDIRWTVLCDLFLLLIADSTYDCRSRVLLEKVGAALSVEWQEICRFEKRITDALEMQEQADKENWNEEEHLEARKKAAMKKRMMVMGLCTVGGGLIIGLSAGLLAPVIGAGLAAGFTTIGVAGTSTFLGGTGAAALIGTAGAASGSFVGIKASNRRTGAVKTFEYRPLFNNKRPNLIVSVAGWMTGKVDDVRLPFSTINPVMGDLYSVNWEPEMLQSTGQTIQILATEALTQTIQQILGSTILTALMAGLNIPIVLTKLAYLVDNPWAVSLARADATGLILADSLIDRNLGSRPITLVGFSLGSRVIFSCLRELAKRGAIGIIQNVYMFGSPVVVKQDEWIRARSIVGGRFVNGYTTNDWILGYLFRATSGGIMRVSGLATVDVEGVENIDVTEIVPGHMAYRGMMPTLLMEVGWLVENPEFTEIEDPDPDNHEQRQRELIDEIESARQEVEEKQKKKGSFRSFFSRKKGVKKEWETYDERSQRVLEGDDQAAEQVALEGTGTGDIMFDVDAIRREALSLAMEGGDIDEIKQHLQIREIKSTMPALKVTSPNRPDANGDSGRNSTNSASSPTVNVQPSAQAKTQSSNDSMRSVTSPVAQSSPARSLSSTPDPAKQAPDRPPLRSVATAPSNPNLPQDENEVKPDHNPWNGTPVTNDYEDESFGAEGEVSMSFE